MSPHNHLWTDDELATAVRTYLFFLHSDIHGVKTDKKSILEDLLANDLSERSEGSLRYRLRNITHVLMEMRFHTLHEYSPAPQVGAGVGERIRRILDAYPKDFLDQFRAREAPNQTAERRGDKETLSKKLEQIRKGIDELRASNNRRHNNPPTLISEDDLPLETLQEIDERVAKTEESINTQEPNLHAIGEHHAAFLGLRRRLWNWLSGRITNFVDATLTVLAPALVAELFGLFDLMAEMLGVFARFLGG